MKSCYIGPFYLAIRPHPARLTRHLGYTMRAARCEILRPHRAAHVRIDYSRIGQVLNEATFAKCGLSDTGSPTARLALRPQPYVPRPRVIQIPPAALPGASPCQPSNSAVVNLARCSAANPRARRILRLSQRPRQRPPSLRRRVPCFRSFSFIRTSRCAESFSTSKHLPIASLSMPMDIDRVSLVARRISVCFSPPIQLATRTR